LYCIGVSLDAWIPVGVPDIGFESQEIYAND
jgi:hypothetical protein